MKSMPQRIQREYPVCIRIKNGFDVAGIIAGASHYKIWKFLVAAILGKTLLYLIAILATSWGWDFLINILD